MKRIKATASPECRTLNVWHNAVEFGLIEPPELRHRGYDRRHDYPAYWTAEMIRAQITRELEQRKAA